MEFKVAIFDLDGTLIDSNGVWEKLDRIIFENLGISADEKFFNEAAAMTYEAIYKKMVEFGAKISFEEFLSEINRLAFKEYSENVPLKEGVYEYLVKLKKCGVKIALATASPKILYDAVLKNCKIHEFFDLTLSVDDVGKGKDFPDIYLKAAEFFHAKNEDCAVFEDVLTGILTANSIGMKTIGVYDSYSSYLEEILRENSQKYIKSFNEML